MSEVIVKDFKDQKIIYLINAAGYYTNNAAIPQGVEKWYDQVYTDSEWLQYLVKYNEQYGILALWEIPHPTSGSWNDDSMTGGPDDDWKKLSGAKIWFRLQRFCEKIQGVLGYDVMLGQKTGIFETHEIAFFIPYGTSKEEYKMKFDAIKDIGIDPKSKTIKEAETV